MLKIRILLTLFLSVFSLASVYSNDEDTKLEINRIKKSADYLYAESTAATLDDARAYAEEQLYESINRWVAHQGSGSAGQKVLIHDTQGSWKVLTMPRGSNMHRCFIYVKKTEVLSGSKSEYPALVLELAAIQDYSVMASRIKTLSAEGKIKHYGRYASLSNSDNYYLVIYNREGKVVAMLTPGAERKNVNTHKADGVKNYAGCGAIGFILK